MHDFQEQCQVHGQQCQVGRCDNAFVVIFFKTIYNKIIFRFGYQPIRLSADLVISRFGYQPQPSASADNTYCTSTLINNSGYHKNLIQ